jgi:hypothetical protein
MDRAGCGGLMLRGRGSLKAAGVIALHWFSAVCNFLHRSNHRLRSEKKLRNDLDLLK